MLAAQTDDIGTAVRALGNRVRCSVPFPGGPLLHVEPAGSAAFGDIDEFVGWLDRRRDSVDDLLTRFGAIRWRDFGVRDSRAFELLVGMYPALEQGYTGGSTARSRIADTTKVFEATKAAPEVLLGLHQEMAYLPTYPSKIFFYCRAAAQTGGETLLGDMRRYTAMLPEPFVRHVEQSGIRYLRNFRSLHRPIPRDASERIEFIHMAWQEAFSTTDPAVVERECAALGLACSWEDDGSVTTYYTAPGIVTHPRDGGRVSFNVVQSQYAFLDLLGEQWWRSCCAQYRNGGPPPPYYVEYGDGTPIDLDDSRVALELLRQITIYPPWQHGDVLMVDNVYTAHGRNSYTGERDVQVALIS